MRRAGTKLKKRASFERQSEAKPSARREGRAVGPCSACDVYCAEAYASVTMWRAHAEPGATGKRSAFDCRGVRGWAAAESARLGLRCCRDRMAEARSRNSARRAACNPGPGPGAGVIPMRTDPAADERSRCSDAFLGAGWTSQRSRAATDEGARPAPPAYRACEVTHWARANFDDRSLKAS